MTDELNVLDILIVIAKHKITLLINFILVCIAAVVFSCMLTKYYRAQVVFIPQGPSSGSISPLLDMNLGGDFLGASKLSKRQYVVLLDSRELREQVIRKFDLIERYKNTNMPNPMDKTLIDLKKTLTVGVEEEGGLGLTNVLSITINAIDKDPLVAADMANYTFDMLEQKIREINSREHESVITFLEKQILICDEKLAAARERKKQFQLANHAYQVPQQVSMVLQAIAAQKAEVLALESQKMYMQSIHDAGYDGLKVINQKISSLNAKIAEMENNERGDIFPGLVQSVDLADEYIDMLKDVETYVQLRFLLVQQLEQARLRRAKDYSGIYVVDRARPPQYKFKPKRAIVVIVIVGLYMSALILLLLFKEHFAYLRAHQPAKLEKYDALIRNLTSLKGR